MYPSSSMNEAHAQKTQESPRSSRRRRDKPQLSCKLCRRRKLRCDRGQPCSTCFARGSQCVYAEAQTAATSSMQTRAPASDMHDRVMQLERLVISMMPQSSGGTTEPRGGSHMPDVVDTHMFDSTHTSSDITHTRTSADARFEHGTMHISSSEQRYVGGDHWTTIMDSIADLKEHFNQEQQLAQSSTPNTDQDDNYASPVEGFVEKRHALLLFGHHHPASRADILSALPAKPDVDRYVSRYFKLQELVSCTIHGPVFQQEYEAFWLDPSAVPVMWIGLLFSMICLAVLTTDAHNPAPGSQAEQQSRHFDLYHRKVVDCLILGEYTRSGPYVLETMVHYVYIEFGTRADADKDIWFLLALEVNLAMRMGYHRDPSHFSDISPLQGEMRRRLWATILLTDILLSNQMGMSRMISEWQYDTAEPSNLNDADIDVNATELPPSRPETEITLSIAIIARSRMAVALGAALDLTANPRPCSYAEVMRVDGILNEAAASVPEPMKMKSMGVSITEPPQVIMSRLFIGHLCQKGKIMLHQRFLFTNPSSDQHSFAYSRDSCLDASLEMLRIQQVLEDETNPGGRLSEMRWRVSSVINHQFLTATMLLCSLLHGGRMLHRKAEMVATLRNSGTIWARNSSSSREAKRGAKAVDIALATAGEGPYRLETSGPSTASNSGVIEGLSVLTHPRLPTLSSGIEVDADGQGVLQGFTDPFMWLGESLTSPHQYTQNSASDVNRYRGDNMLDEWMIPDMHGMGWL